MVQELLVSQKIGSTNFSKLYDSKTALLVRKHAEKVAEVKAQAPEDLDMKLWALEELLSDSIDDLAWMLCV